MRTEQLSPHLSEAMLAFPRQTIFLKLCTWCALVLIFPVKNSDLGVSWSPKLFQKICYRTCQSSGAMGFLNQRSGSAVINSAISLGTLGRIRSRPGNLFQCSFCQFLPQLFLQSLQFWTGPLLSALQEQGVQLFPQGMLRQRVCLASNPDHCLSLLTMHCVSSVVFKGFNMSFYFRFRFGLSCFYFTFYI